MKSNYQRLIAPGLIASTLVLASACRVQDSVAPRKVSGTAAAQFTVSPAALFAARWTVDDESARLAREEVPGFAGIVQDDDGNFTVLLSDTGTSRTKLKILQAKAGLVSAAGGQVATLNRVRLVTFDFDTLKKAFDTIQRDVLGKVQWTFTDIDERNNRIVIGVESSTAIGSARVLALSAGVAPSMFMVSVIPRLPKVQPAFAWQPTGGSCVGIQCYQRPLVGGIETTFPVGTDLYACTIGAIAHVGSYDGFITASHCTSSQIPGSIDQTVYSQGGSAIAQKITDPAWTTAYPCVAGYYCRTSDAAFAYFSGYGAQWAWAKLVRTVYTDWNDSNGLLVSDLQGITIDAERRPPSILLPAGAQVSKIGRSTGTTTFTVQSTCGNYDEGYDAAGRHIELRCFYNAYSNYNINAVDWGDSGGPVYSGSVPYAMIEGFVSARGSTNRTMIFSSFFNAASEIGSYVCGNAGCVGTR
jgi:hypothetical protein